MSKRSAVQDRTKRQAWVTGRTIVKVLNQWDSHDGECEPSDHPDQRDARACARGEHR